MATAAKEVCLSESMSLRKAMGVAMATVTITHRKRGPPKVCDRIAGVRRGVGLAAETNSFIPNLCYLGLPKIDAKLIPSIS